MTDASSGQDDRPTALGERRRRLATRVAAVAVPLLLVAGVLGVVADDSDDGTRVASAGAPAPPTDDDDGEVGEPADASPIDPTLPPAPVSAPVVTVPKVRVPKVTVPSLPVAVTVPATPVTCPPVPPPYEPPPDLGTYEIATTGGVGRMVAPWTATTYDQDHTFAPDGSKIAFVRGWTDNDGRTDPKVFIADSDFGNERHVAVGTQAPSGLRWAPDGRHIAFLAQPQKCRGSFPAASRRERGRRTATVAGRRGKWRGNAGEAPESRVAMNRL